MAILLNYLPFIMAFADKSAQSRPFIASLVSYAAGIGGGIVAVFLVVSLVKDGIEFAKGQGSVSIFKIIGKALFLILIIGLIFLAVNYDSIGKKAQNIGDKAINTIDNEVTGSNILK